MVEFVGIIIITLIIFGAIGFSLLTWNIAKGGVDIMEFFGNNGRPGTLREQKKKKKDIETKWGEDGKID